MNNKILLVATAAPAAFAQSPQAAYAQQKPDVACFSGDGSRALLCGFVAHAQGDQSSMGGQSSIGSTVEQDL